MKRWLLAVVVSLLVVGAVSSVQAVGCDANAGTPLTDGCLYTITGGDTADPTDGFPVQNVDGINWWTCLKTLDLQDVGYPIATTFEFNGFQILALQKVMLQYRPDYANTGPCSQFAYINTMDLLANSFGVNLGGVPAHAVLPEDNGASWAQIEANHLALLDQTLVIKAKFLEKPNWIDLYGLPIAYEAQEINGNPQGAQVLRAQRAVWRIFNVEAPGTAIGVPHLLNVPDMIKKLDGVIIPSSARTPTMETSPATLVPTPEPTATPTPTANRIAFVGSPQFGARDIYVADADGANLTQLTSCNCLDESPTWSPDGTQIAFVRRYWDSYWDIYVVDADGGNLKQMTATGTNLHPAWSPDGTRIAFVSYRFSQYDIYVADADSGNTHRLTEHPADELNPAWSPDGTRIAFNSDRDSDSGRNEIYVMDADGTSLHRLTDIHATTDSGWTSVHAPRWSPDGTRIAFSSGGGSVADIYVVDADGATVQRLTTDEPEFEAGPTWSPDGTQIAFVRRRYGGDDIFVMDADGANTRQVTDDSADDRNPIWSPDGTRIAFSSDRDGGSATTFLDDEIYVMDATGGNVQRLTNAVKNSWSPAWAPG